MSVGGRVERAGGPAGGLVLGVEEACKIKKISRGGATGDIKAFGNAGATAARLFVEKKAKVIALSDTRGGVTNSRGIDPIKAIRIGEDRKSTRLNSSHTVISYAVFCLKKKKRNDS